MRAFKCNRRKLHSTLAVWILLSGAIFITISTLVQPTWSPTPWWNPNWNFRRSITLNHTMVASNLENFPVLIEVIDSNLINRAQFDGDDIIFIDTNNKTLNHEIELYDSNSGHLVAWVNMPLLSSTEDTVFYMYYGNSEAKNQQNSSAVWDSNFVMVQHLEEISQSRFDSTIKGNNGTCYGTVYKSSPGKIDGADKFDGISGYERIPQGFLPTSAITVELWLKPSSYSSTTWKKYINTGPTTISGIYGGQSSLSTDRWSLSLSWNSKAKSFSMDNLISGYAWNHIVLTWNGTYAIAYCNGAKIKEAAVTGAPDWTGRPLYLGSDFYGNERFNGAIDEVRISNIARSAAWIKTCYNNQKNPTTFYTIENEEAYSNVPLILGENPSNEATDVYTNPTLSVRAVDPDGQNMTVIFREKVFNVWIDMKTYESVQDGTYNATSTNMKNLGTTYYWSVCVTDGESWTNKTFSFTTTTKILQQKWVASGVPYGASGVLIADVNGDGLEEVIHAGIGGVVALRGTDGSVIWKVVDSGVGYLAQAQMADLNKDNIPEIVVPLQGASLSNGSTAGLLVLHANNGSTYWRITGLGLEVFGSPVICDIDGSGYPTIFFATADIYKGLKGTGRLTSLSYDGRILNQTFTWRPCAGGLSIGDTDGDGEFELYMGDRDMYLNSAQYGDNDYGKGVQSYWAKNLTLRWSHPDILCSSQIPMLADVNGDGILDVIIGDLNGGLAVLNSTDGSIIKKREAGLTALPTHYQPSVYDIDGDGNLELLVADPHDDPLDPVSQFASDDIVIWDLVAWKEDARMYLGKSFYGPQVADVTGDGVMEIIACNYKGIFIFDRTYRVIDGITGLSGILNYAVAQDIDGDGYTEIVVSSQGGYIYAYDTPARKPAQRPRTEVQFYSEYRRGAAEYVPLLTSQEPLIFYTYPSNLATDVPLSLSELQFTLTDYQFDPMNYTVTTNPHIASDNRTNIGNGRYTISIGNIAPSTTYTWTISVTDGTHWTNKTYTFTTEPLSPWGNADWKYRKKIAIDHTKVSANLSNLPVLISITDADLAIKAQPNGGDIIFTDADNNRLDHETELYNGTAGRLIAWVNVPQISSTTDTTIYMYYGNPGVEDQQKPAIVWDSGYVMVQHLEELSGTRYDSTSKGNNITLSGSIGKALAGKIDGADAFTSNGYERVPGGFLPTSAITVELWLKPSSYSSTTWTKYINTGPTTTTGIWGGQSSLSTDYWSLSLSWNSKAKSFSTGVFTSGYAWNHIVLTWNGTYAIAYCNGVKIKEAAVTGAPDWTGRPLYLGSNLYGSERFNGAIDEVRISNIARSAAWIQTSYNNQKDPTTFYIIKSEETIPEAPVVFAPSPPNKATHISPSLSELSFNITDCQSEPMNFTVTADPDIITEDGSDIGINVGNGRFTVNVSDLEYFTTYTWTVKVTDGTHWTNITFSFTTLPSKPPTQDTPILLLGENGNIICYNQSTTDPDGDKVTNIYNWYRNDTSITNLLMPFDTNSTTTVKDYSGYNSNGIIIRGATWASNGIVGGAYNFNGGFIEIPGSNTLDGGGQWSEITVEHWIYLTASQSGTRTIARIPSYEIGISGNKIFASIWTVTGNPMISGHNKITYDTPLQLNTWYHVVLTYKKGVGMTLYVNGTAVATKTASESTTLNYNIQPSGTINPLYIGWFDYFKGKIDEVRIYPKSLTPQQILQRYNETKDGLSNSSTIVAAELNEGDIWRCEVTPTDSHQDGTTKTSNPVTIGQNNKPIAKDLTITPTTPKTNDNLTATYTYFDPDGDPENTTLTEIRWYRNGIPVQELNNTLIVPSNFTTKGEIWYFTVRPSDGTDFGQPQTSPNVTIQNSPPQIDYYDPTEANVTISKGQSKEFNVTCSDIDGDILTIEWWVNETSVQNQTGTYTSSYTFNSTNYPTGTYTITVVVKDNETQTSHQWTLIVKEP